MIVLRIISILTILILFGVPNKHLVADELIFADISDNAGITSAHHGIWDENAPVPYNNGYLAAGMAWSDFDNDGWVDLFVTGNLDPNVLYHNNQDGTFAESKYSDILSLPDIPSGGAVWADYDNDGWRDLYVLNMGANRLFRNLKGNGFEDVTIEAGVGDNGKGMTAAWGDYNKDGHLDLYVTNWSCYPECELSDFSQSRDVLYQNNGDGSFTDVSGLLTFEKLLGAGFSVSFVDYDNDLDLDLYVANDKAVNPVGNVLWRNDGVGCHAWCWTDVSVESGADTVVHSMGLATGDYDNDGDLDFYFSNMIQPMVLLQNQGDGTFENMTELAGVGHFTKEAVGWGTAFFDYDNDGWLDLYLASTGISPIYSHAGMNFPYPDMLYHNNGDGTFTTLKQYQFMDKAYPTMGFSTADYNKDGFVDFIVTHWNDRHRLYQNMGEQNRNSNWIAIRLEGRDNITRDALGTRVVVKTSDERALMQEVKSGSSLGSGNDMTLHFGLGESTIERVVVYWMNGEVDEYTDVQFNQYCLINQDEIICDS
jgi:enediyne biosynthesis protein E4